MTVPFNDVDAVAGAFERYGEDIAAVIVEPIAGNMGCVPPQSGFLPALRTITGDAGALLIFDEVITGFRTGPDGAQGRYGVAPDLTTLGKVIGGGLPVGAIGGKAHLMDQLAPNGPVYQAGTLSGNPLAMSAGLAMLGSLDAAFYESLARTTDRLADGVLGNGRAARSAARGEPGLRHVQPVLHDRSGTQLRRCRRRGRGPVPAVLPRHA